MKRILAFGLAALMLCVSFASCGKKEGNSASSKITESEIVSSEEIETSSVLVSSENKTSSLISSKEEKEETSTSSKKGALRGEYVESASVSSEIKQYKKKNVVGFSSYALWPEFCTAFGVDKNSRLREFEIMVKENFFNTYFLELGNNFVDAAKIVAKYGGSIWVYPGQFKTEGNPSAKEDYIERLNMYFEPLKEAGIYEAINGFAWDEPFLNKMTNDDFLLQSEIHYKTFGLRNFPVFATGEYLNYEGNSANLGGVEADKIGKLEPYAAKYITDVAFDAYGTDVREGTDYSARLAEWQKNISPNITDGKTYYLELKRLLKEHIGHDVNYWYYPCAYASAVGAGLGGITIANEDYYIAHLDFMAEDVLKEKHPGGIVIFTYWHRHGGSLAQHTDMKDSDGYYVLYPEYEERYFKYCKRLREWNQKFSSVTPKLVDLGI